VTIFSYVMPRNQDKEQVKEENFTTNIIISSRVKQDKIKGQAKLKKKR